MPLLGASSRWASVTTRSWRKSFPSMTHSTSTVVARSQSATIAVGGDRMTRPWIALAGTVWILVVMVVGWGVVRAADPALDTAKIEQLTGAKGEFNTQEGVFKVSVPRSDLAVTVAGVKMAPPLGLTSWAAFQPMGSQTMVMGDLVLL